MIIDRFYRFLQHHMGLFVLEFTKIEHKDRYTAPISENQIDRYGFSADSESNKSTDENDQYSIIDIDQSIKEKAPNTLGFKIYQHLKGMWVKIASFFGAGQTGLTDEDIAKPIYGMIRAESYGCA